MNVFKTRTSGRQANAEKEKAIVARVRREILDIGEEPGWQNYWSGEGYTPDYSGIRNKLETLLEKGHADDVLALGAELITSGIRQVAQSDDHGETQLEIADNYKKEAIIFKMRRHDAI